MSVNIDKNSECKNSGEFGYISVSVRSLVWLIIVIGTENPPTCRLPEKWWRQRRRKSFSTFSMWNSSFLLTMWNSSGFQTSVAGTRPPASSLSNKLLGGRQPNTTLRESSKFWGLKSVDSKLCLNWRVWNEIPVSTVLCWQNGKYVLIPICDHYHYIKLQLSTPTTGPQKGRV